MQHQTIVASETFTNVDSLQSQSAVVSLRLSPEPLINKKDYDQVKAFERSHPELYNKTGVFGYSSQHPLYGINGDAVSCIQLYVLQEISQSIE
jgi:hypothetical protein